MKFKFSEITTFTAPVTIVTPSGESQSFVGTFLYLDDAANAEAVKLGNEDLLRQVWKGWDEDVAAAADKPLPISEAQLELIMKHSFITNAVVMGYVLGRLGQRAKN
ncbi:MAG: hypothetical protein ACK4JB_17275 [Reyranella sp.]